MPRRPRYFTPGVASHVVQRGNNRQAVFLCQSDYRAYLHMLAEGARHYGCDIHAYVLMTNHVHLLVTPHETESISRMMQSVGRQYVPRFNRRYERSGTLWEGRFRANLVIDASYLVACYRYIEMNPVRAGMVDEPSAYPWSSYQFNALGHASAMLNPRPEYLSLGTTKRERCDAYRASFSSSLHEHTLKYIRWCLQGGVPLGKGRLCNETKPALANLFAGLDLNDEKGI